MKEQYRKVKAEYAQTINKGKYESWKKFSTLRLINHGMEYTELRPVKKTNRTHNHAKENSWKVVPYGGIEHRLNV